MLSIKSDNSTSSTTTANDLLTTYIKFLAAYGRKYGNLSRSQSHITFSSTDMASIFEPNNPASPLAYDASQTALVLMDFQNLIIDRCGPLGEAALNRAVRMRDWALKQQIMVVHSIVDVHGKPPATCKGGERIAKMLAEVAQDKSSADERSEIAFNKSAGEYIVLKHPGFVSALKSTGAMELLMEHNIRSLILCGLSTSGCVVRTAMPATDEGFVVSVIRDACADPTDGLHDTLLRSVLTSRAHVVESEEFIERWEEQTKA